MYVVNRRVLLLSDHQTEQLPEPFFLSVYVSYCCHSSSALWRAQTLRRGNSRLQLLRVTRCFLFSRVSAVNDETRHVLLIIF